MRSGRPSRCTRRGPAASNEQRAVFGQQLAILQRQCRDMTLGMDRREVLAALGAPRRRIDAHRLETQASFAQRHVGGQAAGVGCEVVMIVAPQARRR
jgi:hypothetical protein